MKQFFTTLCLLLAVAAGAQVETHLDKALKHVGQKAGDWKLEKADISDVAVSDSYVSENSQIHHYYFIQRYNGVEIYNAVCNVHLTREGEPIFATSRFLPGIAARVATHTPALRPEAAVTRAAEELGYSGFQPRMLSQQRDRQHYVFERGTLSHVDIPAKLKYFETAGGQLRLVWDIAIDEQAGTDYWSLRIDAVSGELLDRTSYTVKCYIPDGAYHRHTDGCLDEPHDKALNLRNFMPSGQAVAKTRAMAFGANRASYNVFALPAESPAHGSRSVVQDAFNEAASPYGWHDVNGQDGAEYTITRGNNVHTWPDRNGTYVPGNEPDGGASLVFDFDYTNGAEPIVNVVPATVNLFYSNNMMHDITYAYGFTEVAGNFQANNYGKGGAAGDYVIALAQFGATNNQNTNNADFSTPPDGGNGRMRMFVWNRSGQGLLRVNSPESVARTYETGQAQFGAPVTSTPLTGTLAVAKDISGAGLLCTPASNGADIAGKIAMVDRGSCYFIEKVNSVQNAGAIGAIICNFENSVLTMAGAEGFPNPSIPSVMLSNGDCIALKQLLSQGIEVEVTFIDEATGGPVQFDGTVDNGIVAHEYGHGISNRLTGGPSIASCLNNDEQMGEGWSDFFTLITTVRASDRGTDPRGIGTYVISQPTNGRGIRRYPYSTDMNTNPLTYYDIIGTTAPHPVGEVWVSMLWDLYWKMVDTYGYDDDILNGDGGNNMAVNLVMTGMKMQVCGPGFTDGRDAILAADRVLFEGANQCLIWEVFARRGLGYSADQGSANDRNDGTEGFDVLPACLNQITISKRSTESITAGEDIDVTIEVGNYLPHASTGVKVTDQLPEGVSYKAGSANFGVEVQGDVLVFDLGDFGSNEAKTLTYKLSTPHDKVSGRFFFDDLESGDSELNWEFESTRGFDTWELSNELPYSGNRAWSMYAHPAADQGIYNFEAIRVTGTNPLLRFFHDYNMQRGFDAGIVEFSTNGGTSWIDAGPYVIHHGYSGRVDYNTFTIPNLRAFSGDSEGFVQSWIDLSDFIGQDLHFKFRFGSDSSGVTRILAWSVDDIEVMDGLFYNTEACVSSEEGQTACAYAEEAGTLVNWSFVSSTGETDLSGVQMNMFPNPASQSLNIQLRGVRGSSAQISFLSLDGKVLMQQDHTVYNGSLDWNGSIRSMPAGLYLVRVTTGNEVRTEKLLIRN